MKNIILLLLLIGSISLFSSCDTNQIECVRASENIITETRDLKDFNGVVFNNWGDVYLTQGPEYSFSIEGPDNVVELTTTKVENEILIIGSESCFNGSYDLKVEITAPDYYLVDLIGGGKIISQGNITVDNISVEVYGIGEVEMDFVADTLYTSVYGQANLNYGGSVIKHQLTSTGEFVLNAYSLDTDHTSINNKGQGPSYVTAYETLTVIIEGSGSVYYKGNPEIQSSIIGTGEIVDTN